MGVVGQTDWKYFQPTPIQKFSRYEPRQYKRFKRDWIIGTDWTQESDTELLQDMFVKLGAWVRPFGKLISTTPPIVIRRDDCISLSEITLQVVKELDDD